MTKREQIVELKQKAIEIQKQWQFPNEHYIEATGAIIALDAILALDEQKERESAEEILMRNANLFEEHPFEEMYIKTKEAILICMEEYRQQPQKVEQELKSIIHEVIWQYCYGKGDSDALFNYQDIDKAVNEITEQFFQPQKVERIYKP